jgi:hypothetical protein
MNKKLQERKKKKRTKEVKQKMLDRRKALLKQKKYNKSVDADVKASREPIKPIVNEKKQKEQKLKEIEHNLEILRKLEADYLKDQLKRKDVNDKLEAEGYHTLKEKIKALGEKATEQAGASPLLSKTRKTIEFLSEIQEQTTKLEEKLDI